jgi:hypothetical protein
MPPQLSPDVGHIRDIRTIPCPARDRAAACHRHPDGPAAATTAAPIAALPTGRMTPGDLSPQGRTTCAIETDVPTAYTGAHPKLAVIGGALTIRIHGKAARPGQPCRAHQASCGTSMRRNCSAADIVASARTGHLAAATAGALQGARRRLPGRLHRHTSGTCDRGCRAGGPSPGRKAAPYVVRRPP